MTDLSQGVAEPPQDISLKLAVPPTLQTSVLESDTLLREAQEFIIDCKEMAELAAARMKGCKKFYEGIDAMRKDFLEPAALLVERAKKWFNPPITGAQQAEIVYKEKLLAWNRAEQERVAEENRRREEVQRKLRQEAEAKAAQERARAEEIAAQRRREEEKAEEERRKAEAAGNARAAAAAAAAAAKAREQAQAALENGEANAQAAELHAAAATSAPMGKVEKVAGFGTRKNWKTRYATGFRDDESVIRAIAAELKARPDLVAYLKLDHAACDRAAKVQEKVLSIPGLEPWNDPIATGR